MNIVPTSIMDLPLNGEINELTITVNPFQLFSTDISVTWEVKGANISQQGVIPLPQSIIDQWDNDDTMVKNYVLQQLDLTEATI